MRRYRHGKFRDYTTKAERERNKALCKKYPFLIPRNVWRDEIIWFKKPYDWTLVNTFEAGWWKAFGLQMCDEIREILLQAHCLGEWRITDVKEKYGQLRLYSNFTVPGLSELIGDYSRISENVCIYCGKPDVHMTQSAGGWLTPMCEKCYYWHWTWIARPGSYEDSWVEDDDGRMPDERRYIEFSPGGGKKEIVRDLTNKTARIRARWRTA